VSLSKPLPKLVYESRPWLLLYRTPTIMLDDFTNRAAWASQFGKKRVNSRYYAKGNIMHYPTAFSFGTMGTPSPWQ